MIHAERAVQDGLRWRQILDDSGKRFYNNKTTKFVGHPVTQACYSSMKMEGADHMGASVPFTLQDSSKLRYLTRPP